MKNKKTWAWTRWCQFQKRWSLYSYDVIWSRWCLIRVARLFTHSLWTASLSQLIDNFIGFVDFHRTTFFQVLLRNNSLPCCSLESSCVLKLINNHGWPANYQGEQGQKTTDNTQNIKYGWRWSHDNLHSCLVHMNECPWELQTSRFRSHKDKSTLQNSQSIKMSKSKQSNSNQVTIRAYQQSFWRSYIHILLQFCIEFQWNVVCSILKRIDGWNECSIIKILILRWKQRALFQCIPIQPMQWENYSKPNFLRSHIQDASAQSKNHSNTLTANSYHCAHNDISNLCFKKIKVHNIISLWYISNCQRDVDCACEILFDFKWLRPSLIFLQKKILVNSNCWCKWIDMERAITGCCPCNPILTFKIESLMPTSKRSSRVKAQMYAIAPATTLGV